METRQTTSPLSTPPPQRSSRRQALRALIAGAAGLVCAPGRLLAAELAETANAAARADAMDLALRAQELVAAGQPGPALALLRRALPHAGEAEALWMRGLLARALFLLGNTDHARRELHAVLQANPDDPAARLLLEQLDQDAPLQTAETVRTADAGRPALRRVVLDPGHGGFDPGAVHNGLEEKDVALDIARRTARIAPRLAPGLRLELTRSGDYFVPLDERTMTANWFEADLFVSLHANAHNDPLAHGLETYRCAERPTSARAASVAARENSAPQQESEAGGRLFVDLEDILFRFERHSAWQKGGVAASRLQQGLAGALPLRDRGVHGANFAVLRKARMPAVLVEAGFLSNPQEAQLLAAEQGRERIAEALAGELARLAREGVA